MNYCPSSFPNQLVVYLWNMQFTLFKSFIAKDPYMAPLLAIRYATRRSTKTVQRNSTRLYIVGKPERRNIFSIIELSTILNWD